MIMTILHYFLVAYLLAMGTMYSSVALGVFDLPPALSKFTDANGTEGNKFVTGAAMLGLSYSSFIIMLGAIKLSAGIAISTNVGGLAYLATILSVVYHVCVGVAEIQIGDSKFAGAFFVAGLFALQVYYFTGAKEAKEPKERTA